ncbi:ribonucleotide-diphosphate reductase subunit beta [Paenibacillus chitinolyticus]|uniref:ribonucleotide-diphosphate reductase subunit beta n=1 Tax=Paenibacillus chitinolyticus TaxID=79263 RepID=UPI003CFEFC94
MTELKTTKLFNPDADTSLENRLLISGETTHMMILSDNKYPWSNKLYQTMMGNFWIPEKITLTADKQQYALLSKDEQAAYDKIISFLIFLDSLQTKNLPNIGEFVTLPEINLLLTIQQYQEALHSQSYGYILESVASPEKKAEIYKIAINDKFLRSRNKYIVDHYQEFINNQSERGFVKVMMANYLLEGIYFYAGFTFFYNLARNGKMTGTAQEIKYINRDELTHLALFQGMFRELRKERPELFDAALEAELADMMRSAVEHEIEWGAYAIGDRIQGLSAESIAQYIKYLSNFRMKRIGLDPLYQEVVDDPFPWVERFTDFNGAKTDFFEEDVINYSKSTKLNLGGLKGKFGKK